jgi:hypothetical protein
MKTIVNKDSVMVWLSERDTYSWARRWPCSQLSDKRVRAVFDTNGLIELAINGHTNVDVDHNEFNAITSDFLRQKLPKDHACYFVCVGQFE